MIALIIYILSGITIFGVGSIVIGAYTKSKRIKELDNLVDMFYDTEHTWLDVERFCDATGIADITKERFEEAMKYRNKGKSVLGAGLRRNDSDHFSNYVTQTGAVPAVRKPIEVGCYCAYTGSRTDMPWIEKTPLQYFYFIHPIVKVMSNVDLPPGRYSVLFDNGYRMSVDSKDLLNLE